jgi:DNA-binding ferritin-like protein
MQKVWEIANLYLATLREIYIIHQNNHWKTKGVGFYGDHLLFQRLYESAITNADLAAEKFIGLFGENGVDFDTQCLLMHKIGQKYSDLQDSPYEMSLQIEKDFLELSQQVYDKFDAEHVMSLGLDDMLMEIASKREEATYLLQQSLGKE